MGKIEKKKEFFPILYLHDREWIAGAEQSLLHLVRQLNRSIFIPYFVVSKRGEFSEALEREKIKVFILPFPPFKSLRLDKIFKTICQLDRIVLETKISLLHGNTPRTNLYAGWVGRWKRIPVIWHARNLIYGRMIDIERILSFIPQKIICNSNAILERFKIGGTYAGKAVTIHSGIDVNTFYPDDEKGKRWREALGYSRNPLVGIVARLGVGKGHETFLRSACRVHQVFPHVHFLVVGRAEDEEDRKREEKLKFLVKEMGLLTSVSFLGYREDLPDVMAALDLLVVATEAEPFGRVILEALASGKPVVGTASGGTPEVVRDGENGFLVPPGDEEAMAEAILKILRSPRQAKKMGERGRELLLSEFTLEAYVQKIETLYLSLLS